MHSSAIPKSDAVLNEAGALLGYRQGTQSHQIGGRNPQADGDLKSSWSRLQPLRHDSCRNEQRSEHEYGVQHAAIAEHSGQSLREA